MAIKTTPIKGKEYAMVHERIKEFRKDHATWTLTTDWTVSRISNNDCLFYAVIKDENGREIASGTAHEDKDASPINKTSYIENCETSAWGRALANLGYGIDGSIASAEEVEAAIEQQEIKEKPINRVELDALRVMLGFKNVKEADILKAYKVKALDELNGEQYASAMRRLQKTEKKEG